MGRSEVFTGIEEQPGSSAVQLLREQGLSGFQRGHKSSSVKVLQCKTQQYLLRE